MSKTIVDYKLLCEDLNDNLSPRLDHQVGEYLAKGWQPFGGVATMVTAAGTSKVFQAVVKYKESEGKDA